MSAYFVQFVFSDRLLTLIDEIYSRGALYCITLYIGYFVQCALISFTEVLLKNIIDSADDSAYDVHIYTFYIQIKHFPTFTYIHLYTYLRPDFFFAFLSLIIYTFFERKGRAKVEYCLFFKGRDIMKCETENDLVVSKLGKNLTLFYLHFRFVVTITAAYNGILIFELTYKIRLPTASKLLFFFQSQAHKQHHVRPTKGESLLL